MALAIWNFLFAGINYRFTATLFVAYALFARLLDFNARMYRLGSVYGAFNQPDTLGGGFIAYWDLAVISPAAALLIIAGLGSYVNAVEAGPGGSSRVSCTRWLRR